MNGVSHAAASFYRAIEPGLWCVFAISAAVWAWRSLRNEARTPSVRVLVGLCLLAGLLRLVVPFGPPNWYFGVANPDLSPAGFFVRTTTYVPAVQRVVLEHWGLRGMRILNLLAGVLAVPLLAYAARRGGYSRRTALLFAALLSITPLYVRYSASDASQNIMVCLFACAAAAYASAARGEGGVPALVLLGSAIALGFPIRAESSVVFLLVPLIVRLDADPPPLLINRKATSVIFMGGALGAAGLIGFQLDSIRGHGRPPDVGGVLVWLVTRLTGIVDPMPVSFFPIILAVPIWVMSIRALRARAWSELRAIYLPIIVAGVPVVLNAGLFLELAGGGYSLLTTLFILLASARAIDAMRERMLEGEKTTRKASWIAVGVGAVALASFLPGLVYTYAYQEESRFLSNALPREPATILAIFDPYHSAGNGDYDCCLALPSVPLRADRPGLRWTVLTAADLESPDKLRNLQFDYYYSGTLPLLDLDSFDSKYARMIQRPAVLKSQRDHVAALQELDRRLRATHHLEPYVTASAPAHTFSTAGFRDDRMTLVLWRRKPEN